MSTTIAIEKSQINLAVLMDELREADICEGLSVGIDESVVNLFFDDAISDSQIAQAQKIVEAHDSTQLTNQSQKGGTVA